jgi:hypothetical protein
MPGFTRGEERHYTRDVLNRRKAAVGYVTFVVARRLARREVLRRLGARRSNGPNRSNGQRERQGGLMIKERTRNAGAVADRASALAETVRPIVQKAINDPQLHEALRQAFGVGREVTGEIQKNKPTKAARRLAENRKLHRRVESTVQDLQKAVSSLVDEAKPKRKSKAKRAFGVIAILGAIAGSVFVVMRKLRGQQGDDGV